MPVQGPGGEGRRVRGHPEAPTEGLELRTPRAPAEARRAGAEDPGEEVHLVLVAHPEAAWLGRRYRFPVGGSLEIGRSRSCDLAFPEVPSLSRRHARLYRGAGGWYLEDLGSKNGTLVGERRAEGPVRLRSGDRFQAGVLHFKLLRERDVEQAVLELALRDGLTELLNRRGFEEALEREVLRALRHHRPLSLILMDVDRFKAVNDACGHPSGDAVLKGLAGRVARSLRREQVFARVGGEEFAVLNPETAAPGASILAEKLRAGIAAEEFRTALAAAAVRITCSFGVAELGGAIAAPRELYEAADRALYRAKEGGRNRVETAAPRRRG